MSYPVELRPAKKCVKASYMAVLEEAAIFPFKITAAINKAPPVRHV
jgi:hypothetical protein